MLKELYNNYKYDYRDYILLIKSGNFYICLNNDAIVMNNIFNYKIKESTNFIKVGFPISSEMKVKSYLDNIYVNYAVIDKQIIEKRKFKNNKYNDYNTKHNYKIYLNRINKINEILKSNLNNNISNILDQIEDILCKIDY